MLVLLLALLAPAATIDRVAAVVNEDVIALSEVYELGDAYIRQSCPRLQPFCVDRAEVEVLDSLIQRRLVRQELYKLGMAVTAEEIDRTIDQVGRDNGLNDRDSLRREVERSGLSWESYRSQLTEQLRQLKFTESVLRPRISVREEEVEERYRRATKDYSGPPTATVEALALALAEDGGQEALIAAVTQARELAAAINAGDQDWKEAVAEFDSGLYAPREGLMGTFREGELMESLDSVVFGGELNQVSEPVVVGNAVFLIKVVEKKDSDVLSYDEAAPKIREQLFEEKMEREMEEWTVSARRRAAVRVLLGDGSGSTQVKRVKVEDEQAEPADTPETGDEPKVDKPPTDDKPEAAEKPEPTDKPETAESPEPADKPEAVDEPEPAEKPGKPTPVEAPEKPEPPAEGTPSEDEPQSDRTPTSGEGERSDEGTSTTPEVTEPDTQGEPGEAEPEEPADAEPSEDEPTEEGSSAEDPQDDPPKTGDAEPVWTADPDDPEPATPDPEPADGDPWSPDAVEPEE